MEFTIFWIATSAFAVMLHIHSSKRDFGDIGGIGLGFFLLYFLLCLIPVLGPIMSIIIWMFGLKSNVKLFDNRKGEK